MVHLCARVFLTLAAAASVAGCGGSKPTVAAPASTEPPRDDSPVSTPAPIKRYQLRNGLVVVLNEDHRIPFVVVDVTYRVGAADDPAGHAGMSHLVEHLFFHGSLHVPETKHFEYLENAGAGQVGGITTTDVTDLWE